ncbi:699_t:CDS:2, partial [Racocetra persica]
VSDLLDAWADDRKKTDSEFGEIEQIRSLEVQMLERTKNTITFVWDLPKIETQGYQVDEICNAAGNTITVFASNIVLARMTENITAKLGLSSGGVNLLNVAVDVSLHDDKGQNLRQAERTVVSDTKKSSGETTHTESKTITRSPVSLGKNNKPQIGIPSPQPLLFGSDHTKSEYTFLQFESRWLLSGYYPLSLRIQFNP